MKEKKEPKSIATINFKGGVGKTTVTWCLGDLLSTFGKSNVLLFDLDAQMSLTQAITLNEDGSLLQKFQKWSEASYKKKKTIFHAIDEYTKPGEFKFGINYEFIYQISEKHHFIPSVEDLYWLALDVFPREKMQSFMRVLLAKATWSSNVPNYDYALFDCPPSFTLLSYSVLSVCDMILIPINPDFYAARGVPLILNTLQLQIEPMPVPKIGVFMNKAKPYAGTMTKESRFYWDAVKDVCAQVSKKTGIRIRCFESPIYDRVKIKRAVTSGVFRLSLSTISKSCGLTLRVLLMNNEFPEPNEEVKRLANEIEGLRGDIQNASRKLSQMERRLRAVFPNLPKKAKAVKPERQSPSTKSAEQLKEDFQSILLAVKQSGPQGFDRVVAELPQQDVIALATELGVGQAKRTTLNKAIDGIRKRVQERMMLGHTRDGE